MRLTDFLAIYGAGVSSATAIWNYRRTLTQLKVVVIIALQNVSGESQFGVGVSVQNVSAQTVYLTSVSFLYPFGRQRFLRKLGTFLKRRRWPHTDGWCHSRFNYYGIEDGCPVTLAPGQSHWIFIRDAALMNLLKETGAHPLRRALQMHFGELRTRRLSIAQVF